MPPPPPPPADPEAQPLRVLGGVLGATPPPPPPEIPPPNCDMRFPKSPPDGPDEASLPTLVALAVPESLRGGGGGAEPEKEKELLLPPLPLEMLEAARFAAAAPAVL